MDIIIISYIIAPFNAFMFSYTSTIFSLIYNFPGYFSSTTIFDSLSLKD